MSFLNYWIPDRLQKSRWGVFRRVVIIVCASILGSAITLVSLMYSVNMSAVLPLDIAGGPVTLAVVGLQAEELFLPLMIVGIPLLYGCYAWRLTAPKHKMLSAIIIILLHGGAAIATYAVFRPGP